MKFFSVIAAVSIFVGATANAATFNINVGFTASDIESVDVFGNPAPDPNISGSFSFLLDDTIASDTVTDFNGTLTIGSTTFDKTNSSILYALNSSNQLFVQWGGNINGQSGLAGFTDDFFIWLLDGSLSFTPLFQYTVATSDELFRAQNNSSFVPNSSLSVTTTRTTISAVPLPASAILLFGGIAGLAICRKNRRYQVLGS